MICLLNAGMLGEELSIRKVFGNSLSEATIAVLLVLINITSTFGKESSGSSKTSEHTFLAT